MRWYIRLEYLMIYRGPGFLAVSVADPGFLSWILDPNTYFPSRIRIFIRIQEFQYFNPKKCFFKLSEIWSGLFIPDPDPEFFTHPGSRIKKAPDPGSASVILLAVVWFGSSSTPSLVNKLDRQHSGRLRKRDDLLTGGGGEEGAVEGEGEGQGGGIHGGALRAEHGTISGWCSVVYIWKY
jgi:hypothetical protein